MERNPLFFMLRKHFFIMLFLFFLIPATPTLALEDYQNVLPKLLEGERILKERSFVKNETPTVYLTFDDGPSKLTPQVLDILKTENVKATFFVLGQLAESKKDLVKRIMMKAILLVIIPIPISIASYIRAFRHTGKKFKRQRIS